MKGMTLDFIIDSHGSRRSGAGTGRSTWRSGCRDARGRGGDRRGRGCRGANSRRRRGNSRTLRAAGRVRLRGRNLRDRAGEQDAVAGDGGREVEGSLLAVVLAEAREDNVLEARAVAVGTFAEPVRLEHDRLEGLADAGGGNPDRAVGLVNRRKRLEGYALEGELREDLEQLGRREVVVENGVSRDDAVIEERRLLDELRVERIFGLLELRGLPFDLSGEVPAPEVNAASGERGAHEEEGRQERNEIGTTRRGDLGGG
jgi:hypothetical protein